MSYKAKAFHGYGDTELRLSTEAVKSEKTTKKLIISDRDVSYQFYPHFHSYVGRLVQELLRNGTSGLQAVDTLYSPDGASLPAGVEVAFPAGAVVSVPAGAGIALLGDVQAELSSGVLIGLPGNIELTLAAPVRATVPDGMVATLVEAVIPAPPAGSDFNPAEDEAAYIRGGTAVSLSAGTQVVIYDGSVATLPQAARVLLVPGSALTLPKGTRTTIVVSRPRPQLYDRIFTDTDYNPDTLVSPAVPGTRPRLHLRRRVLDLQLGAVLPRPVHDGSSPQQEPALCRGAELVSLRLRSDRRQQRARARAVLESAAVPADRR